MIIKSVVREECTKEDTIYNAVSLSRCKIYFTELPSYSSVVGFPGSGGIVGEDKGTDKEEAQ
jgi:hypothetical protein